MQLSVRGHSLDLKWRDGGGGTVGYQENIVYLLDP